MFTSRLFGFMYNGFGFWVQWIRMLFFNRNLDLYQLLNGLNIVFFVCTAKRVRHARVSSTSCSSNSVDISFRYVWQIEINNGIQFVDVYSTSCHISSN